MMFNYMHGSYRICYLKLESRVYSVTLTVCLYAVAADESILLGSVGSCSVVHCTWDRLTTSSTGGRRACTEGQGLQSCAC